MPKPTIVLVHGAWAEGASWNAVSTELQGQGFTVLTPPNLLHGVAGDAAYVASFAAALGSTADVERGTIDAAGAPVFAGASEAHPARTRAAAVATATRIGAR